MTQWFDPQTRLVLLYDGHCSLCKRSVSFLLARKGSERVKPVALQTPGALADFGISEEAALTALHAVDRTGRVSVGAEAVFSALAVLPRWRWVGMAMRIPGMKPVAGRVYAEIAMRRARTVCDDGSCAVHIPPQ